ncbi:MAG: TlpA disulfide reductase family protein [Ferruginibacter sp.]
MNKVLLILITSLLIISCKTKNETERFRLTGEIKNTVDQKIYLEQIYFSQKDPEVVDTAEIKNGKFELSAIAPEEGLYRLRLDKLDHGFIFINDKAQIDFQADLKNINLEAPTFNSPANALLKKLMVDLNKRNEEITASIANIDRLKAGHANDSLVAVETGKLNEMGYGLKNYILQFIDTASDPVVTMFGLGYTRDIDPSELKDAIPGLAKRFPKHRGVAAIVSQYNEFMIQRNQPKPVNTGGLQVGSMAPDFTINDVNNKPVSLSSLKGKYVLVDFWASWCGPCRGENPNVVAAFNKYKDKNFTILGVSLDEDRSEWIKAIKEDGLSWRQLSDLKGMNSSVVSVYGIDGIPYNVLLDPRGKIIATALRGSDLDKKLSEVFQ